jgi:hypothetical protein
MRLISTARLNRLKTDFELGGVYTGPQFYRGFQLGYFDDSRWTKVTTNDPLLGTPTIEFNYRPAWKWPEAYGAYGGRWEEGSLLLDKLEDVIPCAKDCIDYRLVVDTMERVLGRKLRIDELPKSEDIRANTERVAIDAACHVRISRFAEARDRGAPGL